MLTIACLSAVVIYLGLSIPFVKTRSPRSETIFRSLTLAVGLTFLLLTAIQLSNVTIDIVSSARQGYIFTGIAISHIIAVVTGFILAPLMIVVVGKERRLPVLLAISFGLLNLSLGINLSLEYFTGIFAITIVSVLLLAIRFFLQGLTINGLDYPNTISVSEFLYLGLIAGLPFIAGILLETMTLNDIVIPLVQSMAVGLFIFTFSYSLINDRRKELQINAAGFAGGIAIVAIIEIAINFFGK